MVVGFERVSTAAHSAGVPSVSNTPQSSDISTLQLFFLQVSGSVTITTPAGWNAAYNANPSRRNAIFWRIVPNTTATTFSFSATSATIGLALYITGFNAANPIAVANGTGTASSVSSLALPSLTATNPGSMRIDFYTLTRTASPLIAPGAPAGQTVQLTQPSTSTTDGYALTVASEILGSAGATGTRTSTASTASPMDGASIIINPDSINNARVGVSTISARVGSTAVDKMYVGSTQIYP